MADRLDHGDPVDKLALDRMGAFTTEGSGYLAIQNSRPQTIGYGLTDPPLLQLAWIAEKVHEWTELPVDRDQPPPTWPPTSRRSSARCRDQPGYEKKAWRKYHRPFGPKSQRSWVRSVS